MSISFVGGASPLGLGIELRGGASRAAMWRAWLAIGCATSLAVTLWLADPADMLGGDPQLAFLLRGMAAIKGCVVVAAVGLLWWRLGAELPARLAATYVVGTWAMAAATMLIWQLSHIPLAALLFHAGLFAVLITAWRDRGSPSTTEATP